MGSSGNVGVYTVNTTIGEKRPREPEQQSRIDEYLYEQERSASRARIVRKRFPDASLEALWIGGPRVFVAPGTEWAKEMYAATDSDGRVRLFACLTLAEADLLVTVFAGGPMASGASAHSVLPALANASPDSYAALLRCVLAFYLTSN